MNHPKTPREALNRQLAAIHLAISELQQAKLHVLELIESAAPTWQDVRAEAMAADLARNVNQAYYEQDK